MSKKFEVFFMIFEWHDQGDSLDIIYVHFSKASDKVLHKRFNKELEGHGIQGKKMVWG